MGFTTTKETWAQKETQRTLACLSGHHSRKHELDRISESQIQSLMVRVQDGLYAWHMDRWHPRGCLRRTTMDRCQDPIDIWRMVIDFNNVSAKKEPGWTPQELWTLPPEHTRAIVQLRSDDGRYALQEWRLETGAKVARNGFFMSSSAASAVACLDENTVLIMCTLDGRDDETCFGRPRAVRLWKRGTAVECARVIFEVPRHHVCTWAFRDWGAAGVRIVYVDEVPAGEGDPAEKSFADMSVHVGLTDGARCRLSIPRSAKCILRGEHIIIHLRETWVVSEETYPAGMIVRASIPDLCGDISQPVRLCDGDGLREALMDRHHLTLLFRSDFRYSLRVFRLENWTEIPTADLPAGTIITIATFNDCATNMDDAILVTSQDPLTPATLWLSSPPGHRYDLARTSPETFRATGFGLTHCQTTNQKKELISYSLVSREEPASGHAVCIVMCAQDLIPCYSSAIGREWIEYGAAVAFVPCGDSDAASALTNAMSVAGHLVASGKTSLDRIVILGADQHGAALIENYPISDQIFGAYCAYSPRWSTEVAFHNAARHVGRLQREAKSCLLIGCDNDYDIVDALRASFVGESLQRLGYPLYYYEWRLADESIGVDPLSFLLRFLRLRVNRDEWARRGRDTVP